MEKKVPEIQKQKRVRELTPEEKEIQTIIDTQKTKLREIRAKKQEELAKVRRDQVRVSFAISKYVQSQIAAGNQAAKDLAMAAMKDLKARDGYPQEQVNSDKEALKRWLEAK